MRRLVQPVILVSLLLAAMPWSPIAAQPIASPIDLADVPLPVQALPEDGYQVLTGSYLDGEQTLTQVTDSRNLTAADLPDDLHISRSYVLDLALPVDRADANADILALVQTVVYELDTDDATVLVDALTDYSYLEAVTPRTSSADGAISVAIIGPGGDMIRSVVPLGNIVLEITSLDATGAPDAADHDRIVSDTLARVQHPQEQGEPGLSTSALSVKPAVDLLNANNTGLHGLYRYRDGVVQPALGELNAEDQPLPAGLTASWYGSSLTPWGSGTGIAYTSVWLSEYADAQSAATALESIVAGDGAALDDPYFPITSGESGTWETENRLSVTGEINEDAYSGYVEVRQLDTIVVVVGFRVVGSALPDAALLAQMTIAQVACLEDGGCVRHSRCPSHHRCRPHRCRPAMSPSSRSSAGCCPRSRPTGK